MTLMITAALIITTVVGLLVAAAIRHQRAALTRTLGSITRAAFEAAHDPDDETTDHGS